MATSSIPEKHLQWIARKLPDLTIKHWKVNNNGWDNLVLIINHSWIFRFPRNSEVQKRLLVEQTILNHIQYSLRDMDVDVPQYQLIYDADGVLPICCSYPIIKGIPLTQKHLHSLPATSYRAIARRLGDILALIHSIDVRKLAIDKVLSEHTEADWRNHWSDIQLKVLPLLTDQEQYQVQHLFETFFKKWKVANLPKTLIHGDFVYSHILFSKQKEHITGIIDFGDAKVGDPAYDFSGLYWDYGDDFLLQVLNQYSRHHSFAYDKHELHSRVTTFYGKRPIFYDILHGVETNSPAYVEQTLRTLRQSLR